jgi:two-component system NtrC family sensor kinase
MQAEPMVRRERALGVSQAKQAEAKFEALLESAPDAIVIVDTAGQIVLANSQSERLFGYTRTELIGQPIEVLLPERLRDRHARHRTQFAAEPHTRPMGIGLDLLARRCDGSECPVEISLSPLRTAEGLLITSVIRDITDRKQAAIELERQVQLRTAHLNALLQFSQELLSVRGLDLVLHRALTEAMALVPEAECGAIYLHDPGSGHLGLRASSGFSPLPPFSHPITSGLIGQAFQRRQTSCTTTPAEWRAMAHVGDEAPPGQLLHLDQPPSGALALPLVVQGVAIGVLALLRVTGSGPFGAEALATLEGLANLTAVAVIEERRTHETTSLAHQVVQLEEQRRHIAERLTAVEAGMLQAARLAAVGQLAAAIAHEINNPLYAARNCLHLLEADLPPAIREQPYLDIAREQLTRIAGIIERMRDFYRPARGELAPADINRLLEDTLALAVLNTRDTPIQVIFAPAAALSPVMGNADQLRQVFLNLILNAIEAMPGGGTLTVRTNAGGTAALIEIQDTGTGIPDDIRPRLFEPFFTSKPNGTGLGLSISAHIVTQHGGRIEVTSDAHGSTFQIALPFQLDA